MGIILHNLSPNNEAIKNPKIKHCPHSGHTSHLPDVDAFYRLNCNWIPNPERRIKGSSHFVVSAFWISSPRCISHGAAHAELPLSSTMACGHPPFPLCFKYLPLRATPPPTTLQSCLLDLVANHSPLKTPFSKTKRKRVMKFEKSSVTVPAICNLSLPYPLETPCGFFFFICISFESCRSIWIDKGGGLIETQEDSRFNCWRKRLISSFSWGFWFLVWLLLVELTKTLRKLGQRFGVFLYPLISLVIKVSESWVSLFVDFSGDPLRPNSTFPAFFFPNHFRRLLLSFASIYLKILCFFKRIRPIKSFFHLGFYAR